METHQHGFSIGSMGLSAFEYENYCRNLDEENMSWCYTIDSTARFQYYNIPNWPEGRWIYYNFKCNLVLGVILADKLLHLEYIKYIHFNISNLQVYIFRMLFQLHKLKNSIDLGLDEL